MKKKLIIPMVVAGILITATPTFAHEVKSGDTMGKIASSHNISLQTLASINPQISNIDLIFPGQTINTNTNETVKAAVYKPQIVNEQTSINNSDKDLLARLVKAEAESESYSGKVAVAAVVLNRVDSPEFPNSIRGVIYQSGQFSPVSNGSINEQADEESIRAVEDAMNNRNNDSSLFFYNPSIAKDHWLDSHTTIKTIGNHVFKK